MKSITFVVQRTRCVGWVDPGSGESWTEMKIRPTVESKHVAYGLIKTSQVASVSYSNLRWTKHTKAPSWRRD